MTQSTYFNQVKNVLKVLQGYTKGIRFLLVMFLTLTASAEVLAEEVTYTVTSTSEVTKSGTAPDGSSATYNSTYSTKCQLIKDKSMTLTLSGYDGCEITGLTLSMKSNKSGGAGNMSMKIGTSVVSSIATAAFSTSNWNGNYSQSYVDVNPSVTATTVGNGEEIVITIAATVNSLYCQSFTLTYTPAGGGGDSGDTNCLTLSATSNYPFNSTSSSNTSVYSTSIDGITFENKGGYKYNSYLSFNKSLSGAYIANTTPFSGNIESIVVDYNSGGSGYFNMYEGSTSKPSSTVVSPSKTGTGSVTYTFSGNNPYFNLALKTTGTYCNINSIIICYSNTPDPIGYTITYNTNGGDAIAATSGTTLPNPLPTPTREHYTFVGWYTDESCTQTATAGATIDADITLYAKWKQQSKYTVNWYVNGNKEHTQEDYAGSTLTDIPNLNDYECGGKVFVGWTTKTSYEHATDAPDDLITNTTGMTIPENGKDYYAVFAKETMTEDIISEEVTSVLSFKNKSQRTSYTENQQVWEQNEITLTNDKEKSTTAVGDYADPARFYKNSKITITFSSNMTKILFLCSGAEYAEALKNSIVENATRNDKTVIVTLSEQRKSFVINELSAGQVRLNSLGVYYTKTTSGGTIATYSEYNTQCTTGSTTYEIIIADDIQNGTITADKSNAAEGEIVTLIATPNEGYTFGSWIVTDAGSDVITVTDNKFTMPASNITVSATFTEIPKASITLSELGVPTTDNTTYSVGDTYTLPSISSQLCAGKTLVGWSTVEVAETDTKPTSNYYELGAEVTLVETQTFYAVFAAGSSGGGEETTANRFISDYADANSWIDATQYATVNIDENITATAEGEDNTGKYYENGENWRLYQTENPTLTLTAKGGYTIKQITITYNVDKTGILTFGGSNISSGTACEINATSAEFGVGNTSSATNGQVRITKISVTYSGGGGYTAYSTSCIPTYSITYDFAGGTGSHCSNTSVPQGYSYTICDEEPTKEGNTFLHWSDGTSTYATGATFTPTGDVTLTAVWKANTYTVTWNSNGTTTSKTYNHGDELVVPAAPVSCDGVKEFVGWTTHSGYYHATTAPDDIFTTKTTPVTANATYYAVFATPGAGGTEFVLGESGTFKMYANVDGTNHYAQGGVSSSKLSSTTDILTASDYTLTYAEGSYTIKQGTSTIGHSSSTNLSTTASTWTISAGANGSWRITSDKDNSRALSYSAEANAFKAYATSNLTAGNETYFDIEFGSGSDAYSDYTTICQTVESIEIANYTTEFFVTDEFAFGGTVTAHFDGGGTQDVTALAHFSGYNMNVTGTYTVTVTYMGATATYEINVKPLDNAWVLTWNVSGKTNTGLGPRSIIKGSAIGELPTPEVPAACVGKTFIGWTTSNIVPSDGVGIEYITEGTVPTANTTYYAVFATVNNFCTQKPINKITSGSKVVIVAVASMDATGSSGKAISSRATDDTYNLQGDYVAIMEDHINTPHSTCIWTVTIEDGKYIFTQDGKYLNGAKVDTHYNLKYNNTKDTWTLTSVAGKDNTYHMKSTNTSYFSEFFKGKFTLYKEANDQGDFDMQFFVTANADGDADITDYTTGCAEYTITYYGFTGGYSTSSTSDGTIVLPVNSYITIPDCGDVVKDPTTLGREFLDVWMTKPHGGHSFKPGDTFVLTQDTTLYAQWKLETTGDVITLPTDVEDLAGTDIYVYGGTTLNIQPGTTTINTLVLRGGIQSDGSYKMPNVWVPEGATLVRNNNKIYLDLTINAKNWYPFAVPFETKNTSDIHYLHPDMKSAAKYSKHFDIKTYDGARRADVGEDKANNWVRLKRHTAEEPVSFKPGVGYIISAMAYPGTDTATIRIPMTVPNTWFKNGEQTVVGSTVRNTIAVTAHGGAAATEHQRHAGWNFVANPYLTNFAGSNVANDGGLNYINGAIDIEGGYIYGGEDVPYVTVPAYDFSYYEQYKLSDVKLSPEWSFFVQVGTSGTMNFTTEGRQHAPATIRANSANAKPSFDANIVIINENANEADHTGLVINDRYSTAYEIGGDLEKMFGSANRTALYTLNNNIRLAYNALALDDATQPIPLGYRAEQAGEYTIQLTNPNEIIDVESIVIKDNYNNVTTNLLISDYTFYTEQVQDDARFVIYIVPKQNTATNLMDMVDKTEPQKVIFNNHLYIIHNGYIYDGVGKTIKNK